MEHEWALRALVRAARIVWTKSRVLGNRMVSSRCPPRVVVWPMGESVVSVLSFEDAPWMRETVLDGQVTRALLSSLSPVFLSFSSRIHGTDPNCHRIGVGAEKNSKVGDFTQCLVCLLVLSFECLLPIQGGIRPSGPRVPGGALSPLGFGTGGPCGNQALPPALIPAESSPIELS